MNLSQISGLGPRQTWAQWCSVAAGIQRRNPGIAVPRYARPAEPWLTFWRDGVSAKEAVERVAGKGDAMSAWTPWTIVHRGTLSPVLPLDCADEGDSAAEALLVFRSELHAFKGAEHQRLWGVDAVPALLSAVIAAEAAGAVPTPDPLVHGQDGKRRAREDLYQAVGLGGGVIGKIGKVGDDNGSAP